MIANRVSSLDRASSEEVTRPSSTPSAPSWPSCPASSPLRCRPTGCWPHRTLRAQFEAVEREPGARQPRTARPREPGHPGRGDDPAERAAPAARRSRRCIMPGDRSDMLPGLLLAHASGSFPQLAGIILLGGYEIPDTIAQLIDSIHNELPIGMTDLGTYTAAEQDVPPRGRDDVQPAQGRGRAPPLLRARGRAGAAQRAAGAPLRGDHAADVRAPAAGHRPHRPPHDRDARVDRRPHPRVGRHPAAARRGEPDPARRRAGDQAAGHPASGSACTASRWSTRPTRSWSSGSPPSTRGCGPTRASPSSRRGRS